MTNTFNKLRVFLVAAALVFSSSAMAFDWGQDENQYVGVGGFASDSASDEQLVSPDVHSCPNCNKDQTARRGLRGPRGAAGTGDGSAVGTEN